MKSKFIDYKFYNKIRNFGDAINPSIIEWVSSARPRFVSGEGKHLLGIGSISFYANEDSYIWGTGVISQKVNKPIVNSEQIYALRGESTKNFYASCGYNVENVALGDPGFLISEVYPHLKKLSKRYKVCYVPHHASIDDPIYKAIEKDKECCIFDILTDDINELRKIAASEVVISQSLHGLIFAESLGVPSSWVSKKVDENWMFKFKDWYSTTNEPWTSPLPIDLPKEELINAARLSHSNIDKHRLVSSFPKELVYESDRDSFDYHQCKNLPIPIVENIVFNEIRSSDLLVNENNIKRVLSTCKSDLNRFFSNFDYPVYSVIGVKDKFPISILNKATRFLDKKHGVSFGYLKRINDMKSGVKVYSVNGLLFSKDTDVGSAILVRPNLDLNPNKSFLTFYY